MSQKPGCLKTGLFGCLGIFVIFIVFVGGTALVAWNRAGKVNIEEQVLTPQAADGPTEVRGSKVTEVPAGVGRVVLDLAQGEFQLHPDQPGGTVRVEASFDSEVYEVQDYFESLPDSSWVYGVKSRRTISGLHDLFRQLMTDAKAPRIDVYLPAEVPLELLIMVEEGGFEADLGGLWLTATDIRYKKGGFELEFGEPLKEPMERLTIRGSMGGFEASRLGNASPRTLDVTCRMGGADIDLRGAWANDADIHLDVVMGGMGVRIPDNIRVEGLEAEGRVLVSDQTEVPQPVLRITTKAKMGEIEAY